MSATEASSVDEKRVVAQHILSHRCRGAGTDANVSISLCGERDGKEVWGPSQKLDDSKNNFERSQVSRMKGFMTDRPPRLKYWLL
jgi:hypothetical protein